MNRAGFVKRKPGTLTDEVFTELAPLIDLDNATARLAGLKETGEPGCGPKANYPYYAGENSALYARSLAA